MSQPKNSNTTSKPHPVASDTKGGQKKGKHGQKGKNVPDDNGMFHYPCDPEARTCTAAGKPYQHPIIEATFQLTLFKKSTSFCNAQCLDLFTSSLPDKQDEKELPKALVGLIATAVYASISDWDTGSCKNADFDGDVFAEAYKTQIRCLEAIQSKSQRKYHVLMHTLFNIATGTRAKVTRTGNSSAVEKALRAIDVDAMPDELD